MEEKKVMTIFYRKRNGEIDAFLPFESDMNFYGDLKEDYELTHGYIVLEYDDYVVDNIMSFIVKDGELKLRNSNNLSKYM